MKQFYEIVCVVILTAKATSNGNLLMPRTSAVVNHAFCESRLTAEDKKDKRRLEDLPTYSELRHDPRSALPQSFTVCSTIMATDCQYHSPPFFAILDNNRNQILAPFLSLAKVSTLRIHFFHASTPFIVGKTPPLFPNQWIKSCMAINTTSGLIHWVVDGFLVLITNSEEMKDSLDLSKDLTTKLVLGAKFYGGHWHASNHKVTNLNIFSSFLSMEKMESITNGRSCDEKGDYLAWGDMDWILHGETRVDTVEMEEPCEENPLVDLYYTPFPDMETCMHHCENLGTRSPSVATLGEWTRLRNFLRKKIFDKGLQTHQIWLSLEDQEIEGEWKDFYDGRTSLNFTPPWIGSKPDGGRKENCVRMAGVNSWGDRDCTFPGYACICSHEPTFMLGLRGRCPNSAFDIQFKPMNDWKKGTQLKLQGLKHTSITYDEKESTWRMIVADKNVTATSNAPHASFTVGKQNWTIEGDKGCNEGKPYVTEMKMSGCQKGKFTCNDGQCVRMDERCNQLPDCRDMSDEQDCRIFFLKEGYNKRVPPISATEDSRRELTPVNVDVSLTLFKVVSMVEEEHSIELEFEIRLEWKEHRATYHNLKLKQALNALSQADIERLWLPLVIYSNTDQKDMTRLGQPWEWTTLVDVVRQGNFTRSELSELHEIEIFSGSENSLFMQQSYTRELQCVYQLATYPFDTQVKIRCHFQIKRRKPLESKD